MIMSHAYDRIQMIKGRNEKNMQFHFNSWLVYFYFYCIFGWVFESTYVSVRTRKLTNRGFMKGPWLPLYGSGAIIILVATLPFQQYPVAVYFAGAIAATVLEYFTGVVMVKLFKVRYWDYSNQKIQFQGHICLSSSIAWGFLSLLMVYVVHKPVAGFIGMWNEEFLSISTFLITIVMVFDFTNAFREAMDLRALIIQAEDIRNRLNAALDEEKERLSDAMEEKKEQFTQTVEEKKEQLNLVLAETKEQIVLAAEERRERKVEASAERRERLERTIAELESARENLRKGMEKHSKQLLLHNPGASYTSLAEESKEVKKRLLERRRK